jgi:glycosyl transferase family 61
MKVLERAGIHLAPRRVPLRKLQSDVVLRKPEILHGPEQVTVRPPKFYIDRTPSRFAAIAAEAAHGYQTSSCELVAFENARFEIPSGLISIAGAIPAETLLQRIWPHSYQYLPALRLRLSRARTLPTGCLATLPHWRNYYHWLAEILPLWLRLADRCDAPIYVPQERPAFASVSLSMLGLIERCISLDPGVYESSPLYVATIPGSGLNRPSPANIALVRKALLARMPNAGEASRRLYVSRRDAPERRVENEAQLVSTLEQYGFETITPSELGVDAQLRLFSEAECVLGAHGAGLANMIVAPRSCQIIELIGDKVVNPPYLVLASVLGMPYSYVRSIDRYRELVVPVVDVEQAVETALGH